MGQPHGKVKLYVANISYDATDKDLQEFFSQHGTVKEASIIMDRETHKSRGFGFVQMNTPVEAERALALDGEKFMGRTITVSFARERER
jgi:RNA recognition motif-containing protein